MSDLHAMTDYLTHLLFVDRDPSLACALEEPLFEQGYALHAAVDFDRARELLAAHPICLAIIDIAAFSSGQESGFEFAHWLREDSPYAFVDLLFTSKAYPSRFYRETAMLRYQALEYLDKPVALETWLELLEAYESGQLMGSLGPPPAPEKTPQEEEPEHGAADLFQRDQFLLDPEEWIESVFGGRQDQKSSGFQESLQEARAASMPAQEEPQERPITESGASGIRPSATAPLPESKTTPTAKVPTGLPYPSLPSSSGELSSSPLAQIPEGLPAPLTPGTSGELSYPSLPSHPPPQEPPATALIRPKTLRHTPIPPSHPVADPERERPTLSSPIDELHQRAQDSYEEGMQALQRQELPVALEAFHRAATLRPRPHYTAYYAWTLALSFPDTPAHLNEAETLLTNAVQAAPSYEHGYLLLGKFYQRQQRSQEALDLYQKALSIQPQFQEIYREYRLLQLQMTR